MDISAVADPPVAIRMRLDEMIRFRSLHLPMLVRCPCCPLSGLIVCLCCHVNAQPLPAVHGGALQQTNLFNWRLPVQETVAHLLVLKTCYSRRLNQASFI